MGELAMHIRIEVFVAAAVAALAGVAQPAEAQPAAASPAAPAEASVVVPRAVLERYVGRYELNGAILTVGLTGDGRLTAELSGQPPGPPMRTVSANEFANDAVGVHVFFEGDGPKATRIRSRYNGTEVVGTRIADAPGASPTAAAPPASFAASLDAAARQAVVTQLATALRDRYVFPDIAEQAATKINAALVAGEYDSLDQAAFAARLNADVAEIAHDKHLNVGWQGGPPPGPPPGAGPMPRMEAGVVRADKLAGDIGYIEVAGFPPPQAFKPALDRAMAGLAGSKALIIDVRRNGGGSPPAVTYLVSYLLAADQRVHINDIVGRTPGTTEFTRTSSYSEPTPVSFAGVPVYVLTSQRTFSGGEEFAYDVKALGRATLVGELTGGGANPTGGVPLGNGFMASIPFGRAENPITGSNWEGHGVDPDVAVPAGDALKVALERLGAEPAADIAAASREQVFAPRSVPTAGTEAALRSFVAGLATGSPDYDKLSSQFAEVVRQQLPMTQSRFASLGELKSVTYREPGAMGGDAYDVVFANGGLIMSVMLDADGKIAGGTIQPVGPPGR
jgi:hypothetical protein